MYLLKIKAGIIIIPGKCAKNDKEDLSGLGRDIF
jgi:hypothetical protein